MDHVYVQLERSSIALHYSMGNKEFIDIFVRIRISFF
jgi:hypothetical protein